MSNPGYLFAAFAFGWALTFAYVWLLSRRNAELQRQLEALQKRLDAGN